MSRTDDHRPFWVKLLDHPGNYKEVHNHGSKKIRWIPATQQWITIAHDFCDLPVAPTHWPNNKTECHWTYTRKWVNSGAARCGCPMCTDKDDRRRRRRRERQLGRREARNYDRNE